MLCSAVLRSAMLSYIVLPCRTTVRCADLRCASQCHPELRSQSYAMLCRAMLCYNELRYVKLRMCYALLCCSTQRHVELRSAATRFYAVLRRATLIYAVLRCDMLRYAGSAELRSAAALSPRRPALCYQRRLLSAATQSDALRY